VFTNEITNNKYDLGKQKLDIQQKRATGWSPLHVRFVYSKFVVVSGKEN